MTTELPIYQIDAFADAVFGGNPAAVVPLPDWLPDATLQQIAAENNLAETAFLVEESDGYQIRWFTPVLEVPLCGHATLASAAVVFRFVRPGLTKINFSTRTAGPLSVTQDGEILTLDFPSQPLHEVPVPAGLEAALGAKPAQILGRRQLFCVFKNDEEVTALKPDFRLLAAIDADGVIATAPGRDGIDFVSRYFAPHAGIDEDPVTGSTHCLLIPYWAQRLGKARLVARQVSARGGTLFCEDRGDRVSIGGRAQLYLKGMILIP